MFQTADETLRSTPRLSRQSGTMSAETIREYRKDQTVFTQGDLADTVFYIQSGQAKLTIISQHGKEAVVAFPKSGDFFGEGCMAGQPRRAL
jgi:CRP/FNR family cyclic AMP-dependent transcriptional regulator